MRFYKVSAIAAATFSGGKNFTGKNMVKKTTKKFLLSLLCVFLALLTVVIGYAAYVLLSYYRLEDYIALPVSAARADAEESGKADVPCRVTALKTETSYTATTFNIGFGAYTPDFTFFMDGGKQRKRGNARKLRFEYRQRIQPRFRAVSGSGYFLHAQLPR